MRLTRLDLQGFKSFFHRTSLALSPGISAVVGPNGCGKSNIADAIRWVMGEQSPNRLRGRSMEDIIFAGSESNRSLGMAEVSLTLTRTNGPFPTPFNHYQELTVTRRLYRSGESEYLINRVPCRLKDILHLFMDTGLGNRGYAIIEQGSISRVIDSRPEDRRAWIEEAAGVVKFKAQRQTALRKMEATSHNLERVQDILGEVVRQAASLKRQAKKAQRAREFRERVRRLDLALAALNHERLTRQLDQEESLERTQRDRRDLLLNKEAALSAALEADRLKLSQQERDLADAREERFRLGSRVQSLEQEQVHLQDSRAALKRRQEQDSSLREQEEASLAELDQELESLQVRRSELAGEVKGQRAAESRLQAGLDQAQAEAAARRRAVSETKDRLIDAAAGRATARNALLSARQGLDSLEARRQRLDQQAGRAERERVELGEALEQAQSGLDQALARLTGFKEELIGLAGQEETLSRELAEVDEDLAATRQEGRSLAGQLDGLEALNRDHAGLAEGVKALLEDPDLGRPRPFLGLLAESIQVEGELEAAVEAALAGGAEHLAAESQDALVQALEHLARADLGRASLMTEALLSETPEPEPAPAEARLLSEAVQFVGPAAPLGRALIGPCLLAADLPAALRVWRADAGRRPVVTLSGERIAPPGVVSGGARPRPEASLLARQRSIRELSERLERLRAREQELAQARQAAADRLAGLKDRADRLNQARRQAEAEQVTAEKEVSSLSVRLRELGRLSQVVAAEAEGLAAEEERLRTQEEEQTAELARLEEEQVRLDQALTEAEAEAEAAGQEAGRLGQDLTGLKVELSRLLQQQDQLSGQADRLGRDKVRTRERIDSLAAQVERAEVERAGLARRVEEAEAELRELTVKIREAEREMGLKQQRLAIYQEELAERAQGLKELKDSVRQAEEQVRQAGLALSQTRFELDHLVREIQERYQIDLAAEADRFIDRELDQAAAQADLAHLQKRLERLGPVNPTAVEEFKALEERRSFLEGQLNDLTASMDDLRQAIRKINKTSLERFMDTFRSVAAKMEEICPILFGEGAQVQLLLSQPDDPLESGVELKVQPPGKKLASMGLLSGGEKALAAATLLFAIFLHRPSPFCLLDEVDAPLDEHNVERFSRLVKEIGRHSQILLITHNRRTMETVDALYGVTMPEPGVSRLVSVRLDANGEGRNGLVQEAPGQT